MRHTTIQPTGPAPKRALRVGEFCVAYSIGRTTFYAIVAAGDLATRKVGRITLVDVEEAERWFASLATAAR